MPSLVEPTWDTWYIEISVYPSKDRKDVIYNRTQNIRDRSTKADRPDANTLCSKVATASHL